VSDLAAAETSPVALRPLSAAPLLVSAQTRTHQVRAGRIPRIVLLLSVAVVVYTIDVLTKLMAVAFLTEDDPVRIGHTSITLRLIRNPGAAFGLGVGATAVFTVVTAIVIGAVLRTARRLGSLRWALALGLLLGGSLGNLSDRLSRSPGPLRGHVVDFIDFPGWPIFNLADAFICMAGLMIVLLALRNVPISGRPHGR
jgi:signal peptidase II